MRVAIYLPTIAATHGGGFTYSQEIARALLASESEFEFVLAGDSEKPPLPGISRYVQLPPAAPTGSAKERLRWRLKGALGVPRASGQARTDTLRRAGVRIAYSPGPWAPSHDVPYITTVWDLQHRLQPWFPEVSNGREWESREATYSSLLPRATRIVVGTEQGRDEVERFYRVAAGNITKVQFPTPSFALDASDRDPERTLRKHGLEPAGYLFYPAQFWPHKNHILLLEVLRILADRGRPRALVLVGSDKGNLQYVLRQAAKSGVADLLVPAGFVEQDELVDLYRGAHALAFASLFGPDNLPPLEAFALGCPVIASDVPGAAEQLGDAAVRVPPHDPRAWADAIEALDEEPFRREQTDRGFERAHSFTSADFKDSLVHVLAGIGPSLDTWGIAQ